MKDDLRNQLRAIRNRLGISQQDLALSAGVTRQTIGGIEAGQYAASATVALRLAKALGCRVEDIFWLENDASFVEAELMEEAVIEGDACVSLAFISKRWIARPLQGKQAFREEMIPADGTSRGADGASIVRVHLLDEIENLKKTVAIAGCAPAISLWTRSAERWHPGLRVHWNHGNSMAALQSLARGEVHIAGVHLHDPLSGEDNVPFVRRALPGQEMVLVNLGVWEEGFVVAPGNPHNIRNAGDLLPDDVTIVNREIGAGARALLDSVLQDDTIAPSKIRGYANEVRSHQEVVERVAQGHATAGISTAAMAAANGLSFVPLRKVRYDLAMRKETYQWEVVGQLLNTLNHRWMKSQLRILGGYDTARTGEVVAEIRGE